MSSEEYDALCANPIESKEADIFVQRLQHHAAHLREAFDTMEELRNTNTDSIYEKRSPHTYDHCIIEPSRFGFELHGSRDDGIGTGRRDLSMVEYYISFSDFFDRFDVWLADRRKDIAKKAKLYKMREDDAKRRQRAYRHQEFLKLRAEFEPDSA